LGEEGGGEESKEVLFESEILGCVKELFWGLFWVRWGDGVGDVIEVCFYRRLDTGRFLG